MKSMKELSRSIASAPGWNTSPSQAALANINTSGWRDTVGVK